MVVTIVMGCLHMIPILSILLIDKIKKYTSITFYPTMSFGQSDWAIPYGAYCNCF